MNNLIINGGCESDQINVGSLLTLANGGAAKSVCDSFQAQYGSVNGGVVKVQRIADGPAGIGSCIELTCTTAASSVAKRRRVKTLPKCIEHPRSSKSH